MSLRPCVVFALAATACASPNAVREPKHGAVTCPLAGCVATEREGAAPEVKDDHAGPVERACDAKSPALCTSDALQSWAAGGARARVRALFDRACSLGDADGCLYAGRMHLDGIGGALDEARGEAALMKACDGDRALACDVLARRLSGGKSDGESATRAKLFEWRGDCLRGAGVMCFNLALAFDRGTSGAAKDAKKAAAFYKRGCDADDVASCNNLANSAYYGEGVEKNLERAFELYEHACHGGELLACANVAFMYEHGEWARRDLARAEALYAGTCSSGVVYACIHVAMFDEYRRGVPRDPERALAHWKSACDRGVPAACGFLGVMLEDGVGAARDEPASTRAFQKGCALHDANSCMWLRDHRAAP